MWIKRVGLYNAQGEQTTTFRNGDALTVRIRYHAPERVEKPVFGLALYHQSGAHLSGPNSQFARLAIPWVQGDGMVEYTVEDLPLLEGDYSLSVAAVSDDDREMYDYHDRLYPLRVYPGRSTERYGMIALGGAWLWSADQPSADQPTVPPDAKHIVQA
jgi:lipopolysaccharide transport system ATP-binding protein